MSESESGALRRRVLLRDVAEAAHVSKSTASRALADHPRISRATRQAVQAAAADLEYVPNAAARSLRRRHTSTLGLLIPNLSDPVHGQIASSFEEVASQAGFCVMMVAGDSNPPGSGSRSRSSRSTAPTPWRSSSEHHRRARRASACDPARLVLVQPDHRSLPARADGPATPG